MTEAIGHLTVTHHTHTIERQHQRKATPKHSEPRSPKNAVAITAVGEKRSCYSRKS